MESSASSEDSSIVTSTSLIGVLSSVFEVEG
jgi:hypothetical protein